MRLGFDLDGTVADLQGALALEVHSLFPDIDPASLPRSPATSEPSAPEPEDDRRDDRGSASPTLSGRQRRQLWRAVCDRENFWETLDEIEVGAIERLSRLVQERRWELLFLTSRPETRGDTAQLQSCRWLAAHGFVSPSVFVVHGSRGKIAAALQLDVLVDDRPENCVDVSVDSDARAILVWRGNDEHILTGARRLGIGTVNSVAQCLDILETLGREGRDPSGMLKRLKRLLGVGTREPKPARTESASVSDPHLPASRRTT